MNTLALLDKSKASDRAAGQTGNEVFGGAMGSASDGTGIKPRLHDRKSKISPAVLEFYGMLPFA